MLWRNINQGKELVDVGRAEDIQNKEAKESLSGKVTYELIKSQG